MVQRQDAITRLHIVFQARKSIQTASKLLQQALDKLAPSAITLTNADIAAYPALLDSFSAASDLKVKVEDLLAMLTIIALVAGVAAMDTARPAYTV